MPLRGLGLKDRRVLVHSVDEIVVDAVAAPMDDFRCLLGFGGRRSIFDDGRQGFKCLDRHVVQILPFRRRPLTDGKSAMNLSAVTGIGAADLGDQTITFMQLSAGMKW